MANCDYFSNTGVTCDATAFHSPRIFYKRVRPHVLPAQTLRFCVRFDGSLSDNNYRISEKAHFQIINIEFGKRSVVRLDPLWK